MNLDLEAAKVAQEIINETASNESSEVGNLITKTLGVLQENGVYACTLYLYSRTSASDKAVSKVTGEKLLEMAIKIIKLLDKDKKYLDFLQKYNDDDEVDEVLKFLTNNICNDLDILLLTKQLWEQALTYARHAAKARE